jgi:hypothetical protein
MKRGQFFLIAAVIAVIIIFSFLGLVVFKKYTPSKVYDLGKNFKFEVAEIIAQGKIKEISGQEVNIIDYLDNITHEYLKYGLTRDPNIEIFYIYGNSSHVVIYNFGNQDICVVNGSGYCESITGGRKNLSNTLALGEIKQKVVQQVNEYKGALQHIRKFFFPQSNTVILNISNYSYKFNLSENEQFYLILKTTRENETIVTIQ